MKCRDALKELGDDPKFLDDLSDMPSRCISSNKTQTKRDAQVGRTVKGLDTKEGHDEYHSVFVAKNHDAFTPPPEMSTLAT